MTGRWSRTSSATLLAAAEAGERSRCRRSVAPSVLRRESLYPLPKRVERPLLHGVSPYFTAGCGRMPGTGSSCGRRTPPPAPAGRGTARRHRPLGFEVPDRSRSRRVRVADVPCHARREDRRQISDFAGPRRGTSSETRRRRARVLRRQEQTGLAMYLRAAEQHGVILTAVGLSFHVATSGTSRHA